MVEIHKGLMEDHPRLRELAGILFDNHISESYVSKSVCDKLGLLEGQMKERRLRIHRRQIIQSIFAKYLSKEQTDSDTDLFCDKVGGFKIFLGQELVCIQKLILDLTRPEHKTANALSCVNGLLELKKKRTEELKTVISTVLTGIPHDLERRIAHLVEKEQTIQDVEKKAYLNEIHTDYLIDLLKNLHLKLKVIRLDKERNIYGGNTVERLANKRKELEHQLASLRENISKTNQNLKQYDSLGKGFIAMADEFCLVLDKMERIRG